MPRRPTTTPRPYNARTWNESTGVWDYLPGWDPENPGVVGDFGPGGNIVDPITDAAQLMDPRGPAGRLPATTAPIGRLTRPVEGGPTGQFIFPPVVPVVSPPPDGTIPPETSSVGGGLPGGTNPGIPGNSPGETGPGATGAPPGMTGVSMNPNAMAAVAGFLASPIGRALAMAVPTGTLISTIMQSEINQNINAPISDIDPNDVTDISDAIDVANAIAAAEAIASDTGPTGDAGNPGGAGVDGGAGTPGAGPGDPGGPFHKGGRIPNKGSRKLATVPIKAQEGEFVVNPRATGAMLPLLQQMNKMMPPGGPPRPAVRPSSSNKPMFAGARRAK